MVVHILGN